MRLFLFAALLTLQLAAPAPVQPGSALADLHVVLAAPVYQPDGAVGTETATIANSSPSLVHLFGRKSLCDTSSTGAKEPSDAGFGWRVSVHTVTASPAAVVVSIDWRRIWDQGKKVNGPGGTVQLTLHAGDVIPLDLIPNARSTDGCRAVGMGLEVRLTRSAAPAPINSALVPIGATAGGVGSYNADLWLVHTMPTGIQQSQHQRIELRPSGAVFSFPPVKVTADTGDVNVAVTGSFVRYQAIGNGEFVLVSLTENFNDIGTRTPILGGATNLLLDLKLKEVVQLVMPQPFQGLRVGPPIGAGRGGGGARGAGGGGGGRGGGTAGAVTSGARGGGGASTGTGNAGAGGSGATGATAMTQRGAGAGGVVNERIAAPEMAVAPRPAQEFANILQIRQATLGHTFSVSVQLSTLK